MVIIVNEKVEPPPYALVDPTQDAPTLPARPSVHGRSSSQPLTTTSQQPGNNFLRVVRNQDNILGKWTVNLSLPKSKQAPSSTFAASSSSTPQPNIYFEAKKGLIDVSVTWIGNSSGIDQPRGTLEAINYDGDVNVVTAGRPTNLPLHIKAVSHSNGNVRVRLPDKFRGVISVRNYASLPSASAASVMISPMVNDKVSCTRQTAQKVKLGLKTKGNTTSETKRKEGLTLSEYVIGLDLDATSLNTTALNKGSGVLDFLEVEAIHGQVFISGAGEVDGWATNSKLRTGPSTGRTMPEIVPGITIQVDEPKWLGSTKRKLGKLSQSSSSFLSKERPEAEHKVGEVMNDLAGWLYSSCQSSVNTLSSLAQSPPGPGSSTWGLIPPTQRPRSLSTSSPTNERHIHAPSSPSLDLRHLLPPGSEFSGRSPRSSTFPDPSFTIPLSRNGSHSPTQPSSVPSPSGQSSNVTLSDSHSSNRAEPTHPRVASDPAEDPDIMPPRQPWIVPCHSTRSADSLPNDIQRDIHPGHTSVRPRARLPQGLSEDWERFREARQAPGRQGNGDHSLSSHLSNPSFSIQNLNFPHPIDHQCSSRRQLSRDRRTHSTDFITELTHTKELPSIPLTPTTSSHAPSSNLFALGARRPGLSSGKYSLPGPTTDSFLEPMCGRRRHLRGLIWGRGLKFKSVSSADLRGDLEEHRWDTKHDRQCRRYRWAMWKGK